MNQRLRVFFVHGWGIKVGIGVLKGSEVMEKGGRRGNKR